MKVDTKLEQTGLLDIVVAIFYVKHVLIGEKIILCLNAQNYRHVSTKHNEDTSEIIATNLL